MKSAKRFKLITIAALMCLSLWAIVTSCSKSSSTPPPATNKTTLQKAVDSANWYLNNTTEGTKPGQYTVGSKAPLTAATNSATSDIKQYRFYPDGIGQCSSQPECCNSDL